MAELPWLFHFCHRLVAKVVKVLQHQREVNLLPGSQIVERRGEFLRWYNRLCQHPGGTDDDSPAFTVCQADQRVHALLRGGGIADQSLIGQRIAIRQVQDIAGALCQHLEDIRHLAGLQFIGHYNEKRLLEC